MSKRLSQDHTEFETNFDYFFSSHAAQPPALYEKYSNENWLWD
jgi:hypothetical protein